MPRLRQSMPSPSAEKSHGIDPDHRRGRALVRRRRILGSQPRSLVDRIRRRALRARHYLTRLPLKKPALIVFCLTLAVSPCSAVFTSACVFEVSLLASALSPVPL